VKVSLVPAVPLVIAYLVSVCTRHWQQCHDMHVQLVEITWVVSIMSCFLITFFLISKGNACHSLMISSRHSRIWTTGYIVLWTTACSTLDQQMSYAAGLPGDFWVGATAHPHHLAQWLPQSVSCHCIWTGPAFMLQWHWWANIYQLDNTACRFVCAPELLPTDDHILVYINNEQNVALLPLQCSARSNFKNMILKYTKFEE
jgi:hypothetical protein